MSAGLAMIAGFVDGYGMITYNTYLSFMSGNTTQTGYRTGQGEFAAAVPSALAIVSFVTGSFAGALLVHSELRRVRQLIYGGVAALLALTIGLAQLGFHSAWLHITAIAFAMGVMNMAFSKVGALSVSLTFVTGSLSKLATHLALAVKRAPLPDSLGLWDTHARRALFLGIIWVGFLGGAILSGVATQRFGVSVLLLPIVALAALAVFDPAASAQA